jgi:glutathione S-transferase
MKYTLYYSPGACSLAVHIALEELNKPYQLQLTSIPDGATASPEYLATNEKGRVPALLVDDVVITETPAILLFLAYENPGSKLVPAGAYGLARCVEWFNWLSSTLHAVAFSQIWRSARFVPDGEPLESTIAKGRSNALDAYEYIEQKLRGRTWAVADAYSCVDSYLLVFYRWGNRIGIDMRSKFPVFTAHAQRVCDRPAVRAVLAREGVSVW